MAGLAGDGVGQAVGIGVGARRGGVTGRVLGRGQRHAGAGRGAVAGGRDRQRDRDRVRVGGPVVGLVGEAVGTAVAGRRDVADRAARAQAERAVARIGHLDRGQAVGVGVGVVGQDARCRDGQGRVAGRAVAVAERDRDVVDRADRDSHGRTGRIDRPVVGRVGEAVGTVVAGRRHIVQLAGRDRGRAVAGLAGDGVGQAVGIGVGARRGGVTGRVLGRGQRHAGAGRGAVAGGRDRQRDRDRVRVGGPVVGLVGEAVGTAVAGRRDVADRAARAQAERAVARIGHLDRGQAVGVGVGVVGQDARCRDGQGRVAGRAVAVAERDRDVVDRADRDSHGRTGRIDRPVVGRVGEAVGTVVAGRRHIVQLAAIEAVPWPGWPAMA